MFENSTTNERLEVLILKKFKKENVKRKSKLVCHLEVSFLGAQPLCTDPEEILSYCPSESLTALLQCC